MTKRERVIAALKHMPTDFVPYQIDLTQEEREKVLKNSNNPNFEEEFNCHMFIGGYHEMEPLAGKSDHFIDHFNVEWNREKDKDIGVISNLIIKSAEEYNFKPPKVKVDKIRREIEYILDAGKDKFTGYGIGFSLFERAWTLRGMENILCDMITEPEFVHRLLSDICEFNLEIIKVINEYDGLDCVYFGDDWGQQKGLIMGEPHWREFIKPYLKKMYAEAKKKGKFIIQHSCGDIESIYSDLIEIGLDVHNTFQPEIYDIERVKKKYGDKLSFWGGISTQHVLAHGTPMEVKNETIRLIKTMGKESGGYIASPTHGVPKDVPIENLYAMLEVFKNQDKFIK